MFCYLSLYISDAFQLYNDFQRLKDNQMWVRHHALNRVCSLVHSLFAFSKVRVNNTTMNIFVQRAFPLLGVMSWADGSEGGVVEPKGPALCPPPGSWYFRCHSEHLAPRLLLTPLHSSALTHFHCGPQVPGSSCPAPSTWTAPGCGSPTCGTTQSSPISWKPSEKDFR